MRNNLDLANFHGEVLDVKGKYVAPEFIDIHCYGGKDADFIIFDDDINISTTIIEGKSVFKA